MNTNKTLEQLKKDYIETTTAIIDLGALDTLKELQSQLKVKQQDEIKTINNKLGQLSTESGISLNKLDDKIRNINNNVNCSIDEMADNLEKRLDKTSENNIYLDKKYRDINKRLKHIEQHLTRGENNSVKFTSYEGLQELKKIKAEFDNLKVTVIDDDADNLQNKSSEREV